MGELIFHKGSRRPRARPSIRVTPDDAGFRVTFA